MRAETSRKRRTGILIRREPSARIKACPCCGKLVVLLRALRKDGETYWRWCYLKGWDGDPFWVGGSAQPHPRRRFNPATGKREKIFVRPSVDDDLD